MRLHRAWFTVRGLMVAVAVVALTTASMIILRRRALEFHEKALRHAELEKEDRSALDAEFVLRTVVSAYIVKAADVVPNTPAHRGFPGDTIESTRRCYEYHGRMKAKYEAASRRPWLPVEPDPPFAE